MSFTFMAQHYLDLTFPYSYAANSQDSVSIHVTNRWGYEPHKIKPISVADLEMIVRSSQPEPGLSLAKIDWHFVCGIQFINH